MLPGIAWTRRIATSSSPHLHTGSSNPFPHRRVGGLEKYMKIPEDFNQRRSSERRPRERRTLKDATGTPQNTDGQSEY